MASDIPFGAAREKTIEHLGHQAFYDPGGRPLRTITPAFDDRIAQSLRRMNPAIEARRRSGRE
jgi:hypothetical protein